MWAKRGIVKVREINEFDDVLGLDLERGKVTFENLGRLPIKLKGNKVVRITTDVNELIVPEKSQLYTVSGKKIAVNVSEKDMLDVFYRPETFSMIKDLYSSNEPQYVNVGSRNIPVTGDLAYLLGTQAIISHREAHRLVLYLESGLNYKKICETLKRALEHVGFPYRIYYRPTDRRKIVVYDESYSSLLTGMISHLFKSQNMPELIRMSPTKIFQQFIEGVLDSRAKISKGRLVKFYTFARDEGIRRFIFSALALFGIQPRYTFVVQPSWGLKTMSTYLALPKKHPFDLKSLAIASEEALASRTRDDIKVYSSVKHKAKLRRSQYFIPCPREHWDLIADLAPIHSQRVEQLA